MKQTAQKENQKQIISKLEKALKKLELSKAEYIRIQAVLLRKKGYPRKRIVEITGKSLSSVEDWLTLFHKKGIKGLLTKKPKRPGSAKLSYFQKDQIKKILTTKKPKDLKLGEDFWDLLSLKRLVRKKYRLEYKSVTSYQRLMDYCGFSYQKVEFQDQRKPEDKKIRRFKKRFQGKLKKGAISMWW